MVPTYTISATWYIDFKSLYEVEDYSSRIDGFSLYFNNPEVYGQNSTIFSFMSNLQVGIQNLKNNLWSGVGLGGMKCHITSTS